MYELWLYLTHLQCFRWHQKFPSSDNLGAPSHKKLKTFTLRLKKYRGAEYSKEIVRKGVGGAHLRLAAKRKGASLLHPHD